VNPAYYRWVDAAIGEIVEAAGVRATVIIVSDHGMHAVNQQQRFTGDTPPANVNSGDHQDAPPGVLVAAGPPFSSNESAQLPATVEALPTVGSVLDVAPTVLALAGLPVGGDMQGSALEGLLREGFLDEHPLSRIPTHDTADWLAARPDQRYTPEAEEERIEQLRSLGYVK
jgi:arylsulfatase A-like enzyme